jgi:predicted ATP-grasp superfamily ATP-dependent carboligase
MRDSRDGDTPHENGTAVVLGLGPPGLSIGRSLSPKGVTVYGVEKRRYEAGRYSRYIRNDSRISYHGPGEALLRGLINFSRSLESPPVLFICSDEYLEFVARRWGELAPHYVLTESMRADHYLPLLDKRLFYQRCQDLQVPLPLTFFPRTEAEAREVAENVRYPAIVKPTVRLEVRKHLRGRKLIEVHDKKELLLWWRQFNTWQTETVIQEVIIGPEENIAVAALYMDRHQICRSVFTAHKSRQYPPQYGSGSYAEACWLPEIAQMSIGLMKQFGYHGVCGTEFKWDDRDAKWKMVEVNPRVVLWFGLTRAAGVDVIWDAYCDLIGQPNPVSYASQKQGVRWQFLTRDLPSAISSLFSGDLSLATFFRTAIDPRNKVEAVLDIHDWRANAGYVISTIAETWRYATNRMD